MLKFSIFAIKKIMKDLLSKLAKHSYQKHSFLKEWRVFILITLVVKLAAMLFSIFAGYFYFNNLFISLLNSPFWAKFFAGTNLLLIEVLTAIAISKFFKFVIRGTWKTAIPILFIVGALFAVSFVSSTNGLALRQSKKVDNIELIEQQYSHAVKETKAEYIGQMDVIKDRIKAEQANPQGWTGGKRTSLLQDQLMRIDYYYKDLKKLSKGLKTELSKLRGDYVTSRDGNNATIEAEADKFYNIVALIMVLIFLINGVLMFFYSRIFEEKETELSKVEVISSIGEDLQNQTDGLIENAITSRLNMYFAAFSNQTKLPTPQTGQIDTQTKQIGFIANNDKKDNQNDNRRSPSDQRLCKHCNKPFGFKHWNKQFCGDDCRIAYWEAKNPGKKINRRNYKK